ncbi:hypothetical protein B0H63DRAFT_557672 [Podospora didyma]|uniref:Uncharacterized protein n=1 Tax=Podospora didyma TaxID=330526 RepID=A0AAE0NZX3_9PEZI|nr:hypothetical protein B0H63DRAFT_557672 [Podospora didyma]
MAFVRLSKCPSDPDESPSTPSRPRFHHQYTNDRIREGSGRPPSFSMVGKIRKDRKSVFKELGLDTEELVESYLTEKEFGELTGLPSPSTARNSEQDRETESDDGKAETGRPSRYDDSQSAPTSPRSPASQKSSSSPWYAKLAPGRRPRIRSASSAPPPGMSSFSRISTIAILIAVVIPAFNYYSGGDQVSLSGVDAGVIRYHPKGVGPVLDPRANSPTQACKRWAMQTAQLNGTLYIYGGQAKTSLDHTTETWNNDFLTVDLTKSWDISSPSLSGLPQPSGPPAIQLGYLWNDYNNLYLYGGAFSDNPFIEPAPVSTWKYSISSKSWTEFQTPKTLAGNNSDGGDRWVQRAAEGAGLSVPELGLSWYFGGHLDEHTTPGWSNQIPRVYLKSLLEFTHPGYTNSGVATLAGKTGAGEGGVYRNITEGVLQTDSGFSERADGVLVFVPGWGDLGVLIGLGGGTAAEFVNDLSTLDVYDIASSQWYHQKTSGTPPSVRVNPCAVVASAPDASSFQIYLYGGQNLQPYKEQIQYSDMYILSIPSFIWIKVDQSLSSNQPRGRAGHTCNLRDGQIIVVGGYTGENTPCESPGVWVFNASSLQWESKFTALNHPADLFPENSVLAGSWGYNVPNAVASVIGGDSEGHATATTPAAGPATGGPFATGKSPVFTITNSGSTATITQWGPGSTATTGGGGAGGSGGGQDPGSSSSYSDDRRPGLIAAGIIAGLAGLAAAYLGYCAWLYRRQVRAYKSHLAVANRYSGPAGASTGGLSGGLAAFFGRKGSKKSTLTNHTGGAYAAGAADGGGDGDENEKEDNYQHREYSSEPRRGRTSHRRDLSSAGSTADSDRFWAGSGGAQGLPPPTEPKMMFEDDHPTPESRVSGQSSSAVSRHYQARAGSLDYQSYPVRPMSWWVGGGENSGASGASGSGSGATPGTHGSGATPGSAPAGAFSSSGGGRPRRSGSGSGESTNSTDRLLEGQEPSFFSVVMGPRRALRVVNGLEGEQGDPASAGGGLS